MNKCVHELSTYVRMVADNMYVAFILFFSLPMRDLTYCKSQVRVAGIEKCAMATVHVPQIPRARLWQTVLAVSSQSPCHSNSDIEWTRPTCMPAHLVTFDEKYQQLLNVLLTRNINGSPSGAEGILLPQLRVYIGLRSCYV